MPVPDYIREARERYHPAIPGEPLWDARLSMVDWKGYHWTDTVATDVDHGDEWPFYFRPDYSPMTMMTMGVFGDAYWGDELGRYRWSLLPQNKSYGTGYKRFTDIRGPQCKTVNHYKRPASLDRDWWLNRGLIFDTDPLGWFEWYCWYWLGRRIPLHDRHQIKRWVDYRARQRPMYLARPSPGTAQALLHWGIAVPIASCQPVT